MQASTTVQKINKATAARGQDYRDQREAKQAQKQRSTNKRSAVDFDAILKQALANQ